MYHQFSSISQSCLTLGDPMDCSTPGFPIHHQLLELTQTYVHWVGDAIQPPHLLSSPFPPIFKCTIDKEDEVPLIPSVTWFWKKPVHTSIGSVTEVGIKQASVFGGTHLADSGRRLCPMVGPGQWVGSRGLCRLPRAAENGLLPRPFSAVSLMKVENFWLLNGSCGCWKIKRLCLKCRSSWRPAGLRAVEKNVCLTVTRFAYSVMSWEGRLTRGKKIFVFYSKIFILFLFKTFWAVEIFTSVRFPVGLRTQFRSFPHGTAGLLNHLGFPVSQPRWSALSSAVKRCLKLARPNHLVVPSLGLNWLLSPLCSATQCTNGKNFYRASCWVIFKSFLEAQL